MVKIYKHRIIFLPSFLHWAVLPIKWFNPRSLLHELIKWQRRNDKYTGLRLFKFLNPLSESKPMDKAPTNRPLDKRSCLVLLKYWHTNNPKTVLNADSDSLDLQGGPRVATSSGLPEVVWNASRNTWSYNC